MEQIIFMAFLTEELLAVDKDTQILTETSYCLRFMNCKVVTTILMVHLLWEYFLLEHKVSKSSLKTLITILALEWIKVVSVAFIIGFVLIVLVFTWKK